MEDFLKSQSQEIFNPCIEWADGNNPVYLLDHIKETYNLTSASSNYYCRYIEFNSELKQFIGHVYAVRFSKAKGLEVKEIIREFESYPTIWKESRYASYGCSCGFRVRWSNKKSNAWYVDCESGKEWEIMHPYLIDKGVPYGVYDLNTTEEIIAHDLSLRYFSYDRQSKISLFDYIKMYRKYPINEMLMKLGLYRLCLNEKALAMVTNDKTFRKWLFKHFEECQGLSFQHIRNSYKKNPNGNVADYYNSLMYRINCGSELAKNHKEIYKEVIKHTTQEKLKAWLDNNKIARAHYFDYFEACKWLRLNLDDTKVLFPNNFEEMHDLYTKQYADWKIEESKKEAELKFKKINDRMLLVANKYQFVEYSDDEYQIITAKSKIDLIEESSALGHCVGRLNYSTKQAEEKTLICFLRKKENLDIPFVTLEINLQNMEILQCYGKHNKRVPEVEEFEKKWNMYCIKQFKKFKKASTGVAVHVIY